jgi:hypothetical protein
MSFCEAIPIHFTTKFMLLCPNNDPIYYMITKIRSNQFTKMLIFLYYTVNKSENPFFASFKILKENMIQKFKVTD